jgi:hypothetical protein
MTVTSMHQSIFCLKDLPSSERAGQAKNRTVKRQSMRLGGIVGGGTSVINRLTSVFALLFSLLDRTSKSRLDLGQACLQE